MSLLSTHDDSPFVRRLVASFILLCVGVTGMCVTAQLAMATEPTQPTVAQAPSYMRHRPGPTYGKRFFGSPGYDLTGFPGAGYGTQGFAPGYLGGFYSPLYFGSWYQRPYPYHFDIYRGYFNRSKETMPDAAP